MSVSGFPSKSLKSLKNFLTYLPIAALVACGGAGGPPGAPTAPNVANGTFAGSALDGPSADSPGSASVLGEPSAQGAQDGVIRPGPGHIYVKAQMFQLPTVNHDALVDAELVVADEAGTANTNTNTTTTTTSSKALIGNFDIIKDGVFSTGDEGPPIYLMIQRFKNSKLPVLQDFYLFSNWDTEMYQTSYSDAQGNVGDIVTTGNYKKPGGDIVCVENVTIWACQIVNGKYYGSQKLSFTCPYGNYLHPLGTNAGDPSTILFLREQPMQACPNQPAAPVNEASMD